MFRRLTVAALAAGTALVLSPPPAMAETFLPGAPGAGDPYFPNAGNGGYDVRHYLLDVEYTPDTDVLVGNAKITAVATQNLSRFNLDLHGLTVREITVNERPATWSRTGGELTVTPQTGLPRDRPFLVKVRYDGSPVIPPPDAVLPGSTGFIRTATGATIAGEPQVAATWFPVNDHPQDKAAYTFVVTVPAGLEAIANGALIGNWTRDGKSTWVWNAPEPMAPYLATATMGDFDLRSYSANGIRFWEGIDKGLAAPFAPRTGARFAISQHADDSFKRLTRTIAVPAGGADLSFWINRHTEENFDFAFVEAHTVGQDDWTTLPDRNGHTSRGTGACDTFMVDIHPHLAHYLTAQPSDPCAPTGTTGQWHAASGSSNGYEQWDVDLSAFAGRYVEVAIGYASDSSVQDPGVYVDDIAVSTGAGTTSFEDDGHGWTVQGAPPGSPGNSNDWLIGTAAQAPPSLGETARRAFARNSETIEFLSGVFGPYPFRTAGGIASSGDFAFTALENQTRPIYSPTTFGDPNLTASVVTHELAHQWFGDSLSVEQWRHIWLNEGFATYAQWLWNEREGRRSVQEQFDASYSSQSPAFWRIILADPGPSNLFAAPVFSRGAMTLHQLRLTVGDAAFFQILRTWVAENAGGTVTTERFMAHAERISGRDLDALFTAWLFTPEQPPVANPPAATAQPGTPAHPKRAG